jgi:cytochrome c biogenesis protein CcdA/thiol-disulfide isomerase/thioredoxin
VSPFLIFVSFLSGMASVLTPCVLPLLPALLAASTGEGRRRAWGIIVGVVSSFSIALLVLAILVRATGLPDDTLRWIAAAMLIAFGVTFIVPGWDERLQTGISRIVSRLPQRQSSGEGFWGGLGAGAALGIAWAPCAGPILTSISVASATEDISYNIVFRMIALGLGMSIPLAAIVFGGRTLGDRLKRALGGGRKVLAPMGVVLVATGLYIGFNLDTKVNSWLSRTTGITSTPIAALEKKALHKDTGGGKSDGDRPSKSELKSNGYPASEHGLEDLGPAPTFSGLTHWLNTNGKELTLKQLRGKVVLVDFWTYSCINCLRTLPFVKSWHQTYAKDGLVIVGVHAPEFQFEHNPDNVRDAVKENGIKYAVAQDNDLATWGKFYNHYWPAKYLIDRDGDLRYVHYGEGEYDVTEQMIRTLLDAKETPAAKLDEEQNRALTPETYLGYERGANFAGHLEGDKKAAAPDTKATYVTPGSKGPHYGLQRDQWSYAGEWTLESERAVAGKNARLVMYFDAADVHLVMGPAERGGLGTAETKVTGEATKHLTIDEQKLYTLRSSDTEVEKAVTVDVSPGVAVYAFTFG